MAGLCQSSPLRAQTLQYYLPFDDGKNPSLTNEGALGGLAKIHVVNNGMPMASATMPPNLGSTYSESFTQGGCVILPNGENQFVLDGGSMTLSVWVFLKDFSPGTGIANKSNDSGKPGWVIWVAKDGVHYQWTTGGQVASDATTSAMATGKWVHFVVVSGKSVKMYFDGVGQTMTNPYAGTGSLDSNSLPIVVGSSAGANASFSGYLDDFAMWDGTLGPGEISALYTTPNLISGYNAGIMDQLFKAYASKGSAKIGDVTWTYSKHIHWDGHKLGDAWLDGNTYNIWLESDATGGPPMGLQADRPFKL